jgi:hypothetical protein
VPRERTRYHEKIAAVIALAMPGRLPDPKKSLAWGSLP